MADQKKGKRKKRMSKSISLNLVLALAAFFVAGCDSAPTTRVCTDKDGKVAEDSWCEKDESQNQAGRFGAYRWYYIQHLDGTPRTSYPLGSRVSGGNFKPPAFSTISARSGKVVRGGFATGGARVGGRCGG